MQEYKIILTWEAIYDVTDIADYIEEEFGQQRADRFQSDLKEQMQNLSQFSTAFPRTQTLYPGDRKTLLFLLRWQIFHHNTS